MPTDFRRKSPKKAAPKPLTPNKLASIRQHEDDKRARASRQMQRQEKLKIVPGPVSLDWAVDPDSSDFLTAIDKILETQWCELPEKGVGSREKADIYQWRKSLPPLVMVTHLHAVFLNDSTFVEREIRRSAQSQDIRRLMVNVVDGGELVIRASEYYKVLHDWTNDDNRAVFEQFEELLQDMPEALSFDMHDLETRPDLAKHHVLLINAGFLTLQTGQSNTFNISIPNIGTYLKLVTNSRQWVRRNLQKSAWKEMLESRLEEKWQSNKTHWKEFRAANLAWTLCDCYGGGWCEPFKTPVGRGWKLTGKK